MPPLGNAPASAKPLVVGADVGGSNTRAALFRGLARLHEPIVRPTVQDPEQLVPAIATAIGDAIAHARREGLLAPGEPVQAAGVGFPGVVDARSGVSVRAGNLPRWPGGPVARSLEARLGLPVAIENDVRAGGLGEVAAGAARGAGIAVYVSIGTGVGGAVFLDGDALYGASGSAGEIGHMVLDASACQARCRCGQAGDAEALLGGYAIESACQGMRATRILEAGARGVPGCRDVYEALVRYLDMLLVNVCAAYNPGVVVVGGGLGTHPAYPLEAATARFAATAPAWLQGRTRICRAALGPHSGITGAAVAALRRLGWQPGGP